MCFYTTHSEEYLKRHVRVVHDKWRYIECMACEYQVGYIITVVPTGYSDTIGSSGKCHSKQ